MSTTAQKLTYLNDTKGLLKQSINNLGGNITSQTTFRQYATELDSIYSNLPKVSGTGSVLSLSPTLKGRLGSVLKGNTLQDGTPTPDTPVEIQSVTGLQKVSVEGKNLYNINNFSISSWDTGGGNYTSKVDNTILTTSDFTIYRSKCVEIPNLKSNTNYTFSGKLKSSNTNGGKIIIYGYTGSSIVQIKANDGTLSVGDFSLSFNSGNYTNIGISFNGVGGSTPRETIFENIQIEKGSTATTYEPYQNQEYEINLGTIELNKIGDYQDYITGTPDNWSIKRNVQNTIITEDNKNIINSFGEQENHKKVLIDKSNLGWKTSWDTNVVLINEYKEITTTSAVNSGCFATNFGQAVLTIWNDDFTNLTQAQNMLIGTEILIAKATETTEAITNTELISQLNALYYANSYNGTTNISVEGDLPMILSVSALKGEA